MRSIERSIRKLANAELSLSDAFAAQQKIDKAIDRLNHHAVYKDDLSREQANVITDRLWRQVREAREQAESNYRAYLHREGDRIRGEIREKAPRPGTYEHELSLLRGGYRR